MSASAPNVAPTITLTSPASAATLDVGTPVTLRATANDPDGEIRALGPLAKVTEATITDPSALLQDVLTTRRRGWSINDGERDVGVRTIAAPLLGADGTAWAGVAIQGPAARLPDARVEELADALTETAAAMAQAVP